MNERSLKSPIRELRVPPQNIDAERALLGSLMLRPDAVYEIADLIGSESFYARKHSTIFEAMLELASKGTPIDLLSLTSRLREKKELEGVGGASYITELVNVVPTAAHIHSYAEIVEKCFLMRRLIKASEEISRLGYAEEEEIENILDTAEKTLFEVTNLTSGRGFVEMKDELGEAYERLEKLSKHDTGMRGIPTGFATLDNLLSGLQKSDLIILAARPSMGKTAFALDIARQTATKHNNGVCIFSLEMSSQQLVDRMLASESRVDAWKLRTGKVRGEDDFTRLRDALGRLSEAPIYIDDQPGSTILKMRSVARKLKRDKKLDLIVVDYLQLMLPSGRAKNSDSMVFQITEISRSLKILAREMDVPVLALSQLSRAVEQRGGKPRLSDLRDSGSIEQDADVVMFIHRDDKYNESSDKPNIAEILVEKHRNGPVGKVELYFDDKKASFLSIETNDFDALGASGSQTDDIGDF